MKKIMGLLILVASVASWSQIYNLNTNNFGLDNDPIGNIREIEDAIEVLLNTTEDNRNNQELQKLLAKLEKLKNDIRRLEQQASSNGGGEPGI